MVFILSLDDHHLLNVPKVLKSINQLLLNNATWQFAQKYFLFIFLSSLILVSLVRVNCEVTVYLSTPYGVFLGHNLVQCVEGVEKDETEASGPFLLLSDNFDIFD